MGNLANDKLQTPEISKDSKQLKLWKISTVILLILFLATTVLALLKYLPKKEVTTKQNNPSEAVKPTPENSLSFSNQHLDQPISKYDYALLASPDVLNEQRDKTWQPMECIYSSEERNWYTIADIKKYISDNTLLKGLQNIEDYKFKITIKNEDGSLFKEYTSLQNINYTDICKDSKNYYVLFLTTGDKNNNQGLLPIKRVEAAGGWYGQSNFAVIPFSGEAKIYENINGFSKNIAVNDLLKSGFNSATSRSFAYYGCYRFAEKLGDDLYAFCGGEGGSGLFKVTLSPVTFTEESFCWWYQQTSRVCYDTQGRRYYQYK